MQKLGIEHGKKVLVDLTKLAVDGVVLVKRGIGLGSLKSLIGLVEDIKNLIAEAPAALPELRDIDSEEAGQLASLAYSLVTSVIVAIAS